MLLFFLFQDEPLSLQANVRFNQKVEQERLQKLAETQKAKEDNVSKSYTSYLAPSMLTSLLKPSTYASYLDPSTWSGAEKVAVSYDEGAAKHAVKCKICK